MDVEGSNKVLSHGKRVSLVVLVLIVAFLAFGFDHLKSMALKGADVISTDYNPAHTCYVQTVEAGFKDGVDPILQNLFYLVHSRLLYRVFNNDGELIASTDWRFLEPTIDTDHARWGNNSTLIYPADGYRSLDAARCGDVPGKG